MSLGSVGKSDNIQVPAGSTEKGIAKKETAVSVGHSYSKESKSSKDKEIKQISQSSLEELSEKTNQENKLINKKIELKQEGEVPSSIVTKQLSSSFMELLNNYEDAIDDFEEGKIDAQTFAAHAQNLEQKHRAEGQPDKAEKIKNEMAEIITKHSPPPKTPSLMELLSKYEDALDDLEDGKGSASTLADNAKKLVDKLLDEEKLDEAEQIKADTYAAIAKHEPDFKGLPSEKPLEELQPLLEDRYVASLESFRAGKLDAATLYADSEKLAKKYIEAGRFEDAIDIRMETASSVLASQKEIGPIDNLPVILSQADRLYGAKLSQVDSDIVKNHAMTAQVREFKDEGPSIHLEVELNHHARASLDKTLKLLTEGSAAGLHQVEFMESLQGQGFLEGEVTVQKTDDIYYGRESLKDAKDQPFTRDGWRVCRKITDSTTKAATEVNAQSIEINFAGIGKVRIGADERFISDYKRLEVDLEPGVPLEKAREMIILMLSSIGLGALSTLERKEDEERIKIMQLFRAYHPEKSYAFERNASTFEMSLDQLKEAITETSPDMKDRFEKDLGRMYKQEVYPGQRVWCVQGLADQVRKNGGVGLFSGIGNKKSFEDACDIAVLMLNGGAFAGKDRFQGGLLIKGGSTGQDIMEGGFDSVFARMYTDKLTNINANRFPFAGRIQLLFDLELVERVGYCHAHDEFGTKNPEIYAKRKNILEFTKGISAEKDEEDEEKRNGLDNEICIKSRVGPEHIVGMKVSTKQEKEYLREAFKKAQLVDQDDHVMIKGQIVAKFDEFVHVGDCFTSAMWPARKTA